MRRVCALAVLSALVLAAPAAARPGDLDPAFGSHGIASVPVADPPAFDVGPDGRSFYLSRSGTYSEVTALIDGKVDKSFGTGGSAVVEAPVTGYRIAVDAVGRIVVSGTPPSGGNGDVAVARLLPDGTPDPAFDGDGIASFDLGGGCICVTAMEIDESGRILVGFSADGSARVARIGTGGGLDGTYGLGGLSEPVEGGSSELALGPDGTSVLLVVAADAPRTNRLVRLSNGGMLDTGFGEGGGAVVGGSGFSESQGASAISVDDRGRVVYALTTSYLSSHGGSGQSLLRLTATGQPDSSFGSRRALSVDGRDMWASMTAVDDKDRIILVGHLDRDVYGTPPPPIAAVMRLRENGARDRTFGDSGVSAFPTGFTSFPAGIFSGYAAGPEGRFTVGSSGQLFRLSSVAGRADADADGIADRKDGCPRRYSKSADGCNRAAVSVEIHRFSQRRAVGIVQTAEQCTRGAGAKGPSLRVVAVRKNGIEELGKAPIERDGSWQFKLPEPRMTVYAEYRRRLRPGIVVCRGAKSRTIRFHPFG